MSQPLAKRRVPPKLDNPMRMRVVQENYGFFPTIQEELNRAVGIIPFLDSKTLKGARYLNEILIHQNKSRTRRPQAAVISVVEKCANFATQASQDATILKEFHDLVSEEYMNPRVSLKEEAVGELAVSRIVRFVDLRAFASAGSIGKQDFRPLSRQFGVVGSLSEGVFFDQYTHPRPSAAVAERIDTVATTTAVKDLRTLVPEAIHDQDARFAFWRNRLEEFQGHSAARGTAVAALARLEG